LQQFKEYKKVYKMLDELYMQDLANAMKVPAEPLPTGTVTVSGPQVETQPKQPEMGTITGIPQTAFEKALETSGREIPVVGNLKLRDFLPFVGSKDEGKLTGTPAALIAAGTGQPLRGQPVVGSSIGPDGQRYYGTSGSPAMLSEDVGTAVVDVATLGLGKPLATAAKKAVKATKNMPVGMSTKAVGQGVDELGFYSAAKQAVDAIQQPKGTGDQFLKQIEKTPGVKPDEIKWTGLDDFLKSKKTVTKAEVQEYLDKNKVEIKEVQLGGGYKAMEQELNKQGYDLNVDMDGDWSIFKDNEYIEFFDLPEDLQKFVMENSPGKTETKFSKYTLPGGENYREVLLTLPTKSTSLKPNAVNIINERLAAKGYGQLDEDQIDLINKGDTTAVNMLKDYSDRLGIETNDILSEGAAFRSQHFDQPNILAHLRVNDRVIDGKKTLFVEEVQSDWHQAGRKQGYATPETKRLTGKIEEQTSGFGFKPEYKVTWEDGTFSGGYGSREAAEARAAEGKSNAKTGVPDAPFKTTWSDLSMKRVIQMASEGGYDRIAFTTGKTQADRYDLSKQVNMISAMPDRDGKYNIYIEGKDGEALFRNQNGFGEYGQKIVTPEEFEELVGKDVSKNIMQKADELNRGKVSKEQYKFYDSKPKDLTIGGEGMKGFYDDILPKFLDKYAKKWDAKTGMTKMRLETDAQAAEDAQLLRELGVNGDGKSAVSVNYIDVTPKMRESVVTKGQPMFAIGAGGAGAAATQEENK